MKVDELTGGQTIRKELDVSREKRPVKSNQFQDLLVEELDAKIGSGKDDGMAPVGVGSMNVPVGFYPGLKGAIEIPQDDGPRYTAVAVQSLEGSLDDLGRSLGDGKAGLKTVDRTIQNLSHEAGNLQKSVDQLPADHPMRQLSNELSVLAYVESVKWKRGDYL